MAATSSSQAPASTSFYIQVKMGHFCGLFKVSEEETIRVVKERVAAFINTHRSDPAINLDELLTADTFQLRRCDVTDIVLEDPDLVEKHLAYKYITQSVYLLPIDANGNVSEIIVPPIAPSPQISKEERDAFLAKVDARIQAEYEAVLEKK